MESSRGRIYLFSFFFFSGNKTAAKKIRFIGGREGKYEKHFLCISALFLSVSVFRFAKLSLFTERKNVFESLDIYLWAAKILLSKRKKESQIIKLHGTFFKASKKSLSVLRFGNISSKKKYKFVPEEEKMKEEEHVELGLAINNTHHIM